MLPTASGMPRLPYEKHAQHWCTTLMQHIRNINHHRKIVMPPAILRRFQTGCLLWLACALTLALAGCHNKESTPPAEKILLKSTSTQNKYVVTLTPAAEPIQLNQIHSWQLKLTTTTGEPIEHATFLVGGGMPSHNHGLPTQPKVTRELGKGEYVLEGMKFSMSGWWEIRVTVEAGKGTDIVSFNTIIPDPAVASGSK
jgi:hypothetical protein